MMGPMSSFLIRNEYRTLCKNLGGGICRFSASSEYKLNPFDLNFESPEPDELSNKILDLHSLMKVIMGGLPSQDALLDRALVLTYRERITQDFKHFHRSRHFEDLYKILWNGSH
jgi:hypothetical protein